MSRILKWTVPIDDQWHRIGSGQPVMVFPVYIDPDFMSLETPALNVWTLEMSEDEQAAQDKIYAAAGARQKVTEARVYGTGHDFPAHASYAGSCPMTIPNRRGQFIWHVVTMSGYEAE